jgi:GNAT superfamily N-acetyltransferase
LSFSDLALARRLERAEGRANADFVDARAATFPDRGAAWIDVAGTLAMFDGIDSPLTQTFGLGVSGAVSAEDLDTIEQFFRERQAPIFHEVSPLADASVLALLTAREYRVVEFTSVMWQPISSGTRRQAPGARLQAPGRRPQDTDVHSRVTARPIRDNEHALWAHIAAQGWSHLPALAPFMEELATVNVARAGHVCYLAEIDGEAVGAAAIALVDGVALLAGASTVPAARRQGVQRALLEARLRDAAASGCDIAMMGALPGSDSQRNAERQGFRIAYTRVKWQSGST